jgi:hypothetical protein
MSMSVVLKLSAQPLAADSLAYEAKVALLGRSTSVSQHGHLVSI